MSWRCVVISQPGYLKLKELALIVEQNQDAVRVPLEDISVILLDSPQITLTAPLLSACAEHQIVVITTADNHHPNGMLLPYSPHSRSLRVLRQQLALSQPRKKRLWQTIIKQKIANQASVLYRVDQTTAARKLMRLSLEVRSGDPDNKEASAAQYYFSALYGSTFTRKQQSFQNAALNYGYAVIRAVLAKYLVGYGFITPVGLHHCSEQNAFNLVDDLIEPFRVFVDWFSLSLVPNPEGMKLETKHKASLVGLLHQDIITEDSDGVRTKRTIQAACEALVISLMKRLTDQDNRLHLPVFEAVEDISDE
jgi:CRISPR-associated protein Cas1